MKNKIIAVDFDATIVTNDYPKIGKNVPGALYILMGLQRYNKIILYTMRSGDLLVEAVDYLETQGIKLWGINENPQQSEWTASPKIYADYYIDDLAVGCPLIHDKTYHKMPYVDWEAVAMIMLKEK